MASDAWADDQQPAKHVYLDVCALNRPIDDQSQMRVRLEADVNYVEFHHQWQETLDPAQFFDQVFGPSQSPIPNP